jgi:hypothetical protein
MTKVRLEVLCSSAALLGLVLPTGALANFLPAVQETVESMEGTQVEQLLGLLNGYGPFGGRLTYNVQIDPTAKTYSESLVEGSTYNGLPIQLPVQHPPPI